MSDQDLLLSAKRIYKNFGRNQVLKGTNLELHAGEVLALIGGNGVGKSTLMKIIMGMHRLDDGELIIQHRPARNLTPKKSMELGAYMVPQEPMIFQHMSVFANIVMGFDQPIKELNERLAEVYRQAECNIDLNRLGMSLSIAEQQMVEIMRGMLRNSRILILDEPTSALTYNEVEVLFNIVRSLQEKGVGIIYITHRLTEVFRLSTRIAVMADGVITQTGKTSDFTREMLVQSLVPPKPEKKAADGAAAGPAGARKERILKDAEPALKVEKLTGYGFKDISFHVQPGEILGIAGWTGAGRTEMALTVMGMEETLSGRVLVEGSDVTGCDTRQMISHGLNYVPADRRRNGIFPIASVAANITSSMLHTLAMGGFYFRAEKEKTEAESQVSSLGIKITSLQQECGTLSGGNQQKTMIGRGLCTQPKVVILDEPTRGIDAGARGDIYGIIGGLSENHVGVVLISSDMEEILELSDRIIVFCRGHISAIFDRDEANQEMLTNASFGILNDVEIIGD